MGMTLITFENIALSKKSADILTSWDKSPTRFIVEEVRLGELTDKGKWNRIN